MYVWTVCKNGLVCAEQLLEEGEQNGGHTSISNSSAWDFSTPNYILFFVDTCIHTVYTYST